MGSNGFLFMFFPLLFSSAFIFLLLPNLYFFYMQFYT